MTFQRSFNGNSKFIGSDHDKALYILTNYPEARNSYKAAMVKWWLEFDELWAVYRYDKSIHFEDFYNWFISKATSPKTIQNRIMECQNENPHLDASEEVEEYRQKRSKQGVLE